MKRQHFINLISFGGLALSAWPFKTVFSLHTRGRIVEVPLLTHVRHGMLRMPTRPAGLPSWIGSLQQHVFFGNGYGAGKEDLRQLSLQLNGAWINIQMIGDVIWYSSGKGQPQPLRLPEGEQIFLQAEEGIAISCCRLGSESQRIRGGEEVLLMSLKGSCYIHGRQLKAEEAYHITGARSLMAEPEGETILLLIAKQPQPTSESSSITQ